MILGIIPARGGSKGLPKKNIRPLFGKPLIVWSIRAAQRSKLLDTFFVSTDDEEIAEISRRAGAEVVMRPAELATDEATTLDVLRYHTKDRNMNTIVLLQPTSPIRGSIVDAALERYAKTGCDTLATGSMVTMGEWMDDNTPRQNLPHYFRDDGCVYIFSADVLRAGRWKGDKPCAMIVPDFFHHDIDTETDFWAVEGILRNIKAKTVPRV